MALVPKQEPNVLIVNDEEDDEDDLHLCGKCRGTFGDIHEFLAHKKECKKKTNQITIKETNNDSADGKDTNSDLNLATDEAAVISLLANQLSSQNSASRASDELEQLTLVFKEELDAIEQNQDFKNLTKCQFGTHQSNVNRKKKQKAKDKFRTFSQTDVVKIKDQVIIKKQINLAVAQKVGPDGDIKIHPCSVIGCKFTARHAKDLTRHMRIHTGEKPFECQYCNKAFSRQDKCKNHERIHTGEKPYQCTVCSYGTADGGSLRKHMRIHLDERPFKCQLCSYRSRDNSQLTVHLRTHTNDRPFVCSYDVCNSAFKTNSDLKRHLKLHSCTYCSYKNGNIATVKIHISQNHPNETQNSSQVKECSTCGFVTNNKVLMKNHKKSHGTPPKISPMKKTFMGVKEVYSCSHCEFSAPSELIVKAHVRKRHHHILKVCQVVNCPFKYKNQDQLNAHMKKCHEPKKGKKMSKSPTKIMKTPKKESFVPNYSCTICSSSFIREDSFKSHMRQHQQRNELVEPVEHIDMKPCTPVVFDNDKMSTIQEGAIQDGTIRYVIMPSTSATNIQDIIDSNK